MRMYSKSVHCTLYLTIFLPVIPQESRVDGGEKDFYLHYAFYSQNAEIGSSYHHEEGNWLGEIRGWVASRCSEVQLGPRSPCRYLYKGSRKFQPKKFSVLAFFPHL